MAAEYADPVDPREGLEEYANFQGLRNNVSAEVFSKEDLVTALNVDIDDSLGISRRKGFSSPVTTAIDRDLFASGSICLGAFQAICLSTLNATSSPTFKPIGIWRLPFLAIFPGPICSI